MSRASEVNRLADQAVATMGAKHVAGEITMYISGIYETKTGRALLRAEVDAVFASVFRWLVDRRDEPTPVCPVTTRLASLLRSSAGVLTASDIHALALMAAAGAPQGGRAEMIH